MKKGDSVIVIHNPIIEENYTFHEFSIGDIVIIDKIYDDDEWIVCHKQIPTDKSFITIEQDLKINWVKPF